MLAALLGAIVGGALALIGSIVVNQRVQVRANRVRLFDEIIPPLMNKLADTGTLDLRAFQVLVRAASLAGRSDYHKANAIWTMASSALERHNNSPVDVYGNRTPEATARLNLDLAEISQALKELGLYVGGKVRPRL